MKKKTGEIRVGFELEVMFDAEEYPALVEVAKKNDFHWQGSDGEAPLYLRRKIAADLSEFLGVKVVAPAKPSVALTKKWSVLEEYDIEDGAYSNAVCAVEIVTPPVTVRSVGNVLSELFTFCLNHGGFTDDNCGLHMTFDLPEQHRHYVALSLALKLDERSFATRFDRDRSSYTIPQKDKLVVEASAALIDGNRHALDHSFLEHSLGIGKSYAMNLEKVEKFGVVEFRYCGGEGILYADDEVSDLVELINSAIEKTQSEFESTKTGDEFARYFEGIIVDQVQKTVAYTQRLTIGEPKVPLMGRQEYPVFFDGQQVGAIFQPSPARFNFHPKGGGAPFSVLEVDSLSKAKALVAFNIWHTIELQ